MNNNCLYFFVIFSLQLQAANFFLKYGYIVERSDESRPTLHIKKAIRDLQKFGGLPVTGQLDQATLKLIGTKRCGMKDPVKKVKRVGAIQGEGEGLTCSNNYKDNSVNFPGSYA